MCIRDSSPARAGRTVNEDADLVPFTELMQELEARRALEQLKKRELER